FKPGARNAVRTCMGVGPEDRVAVIEDESSREIAAAIAEESAEAGAQVERFVLEKLGPRPISSFEDSFAALIRETRPTVSFYIARQVPAEITFRQRLVNFLTIKLRCRHGHMVGIDDRLMTDGMAGDYAEIYRMTHAVYDVVRHARRIEVRTELG